MATDFAQRYTALGGLFKESKLFSDTELVKKISELLITVNLNTKTRVLSKRLTRIWSLSSPAFPSVTPRC